VADTTTNATPSGPTFETHLAELEEVVRQLETGDLPLEQSLELFEKGTRLSESCRKQLEDAESRVEVLLRRGEQVRVEPLELEGK